ncbi:MAG: phosphodiesterase [Sporolactobacillus sp.]
MAIGSGTMTWQEWLDVLQTVRLRDISVSEAMNRQITCSRLTFCDRQMVRWVRPVIFNHMNDMREGIAETIQTAIGHEWFSHSGNDLLRKGSVFLLASIGNHLSDYCRELMRFLQVHHVRQADFILLARSFEQWLLAFLCDTISDVQRKHAIIEAFEHMCTFKLLLVCDCFERMEARSRKKQERFRRRQAYHDPLTGLLNERALSALLRQGMNRASGQAKAFYLIKLNTHRLKMLKQGLPSQESDGFVRAFADRLKSVGISQRALLFRNHGQFMMVCRGDFRRVRALAERLAACTNEPYCVGGRKIYGGFTMGIAAYPQHGRSGDELFANVEAALQEAGRQPHGYFFYTRALHAQLLTKIAIENELQHALQTNQFALYFQPQIRATDRRLIGVESLIRWLHPTRGTIAPGQFIAIAEETGLINDIGQWVLVESCRQMRRWQECGGPKIPISVNVSISQFQNAQLIENIASALQESGLIAQYLDLEITESTMAEDMGRSKALLGQMRNMGLSVSLDDFGTGYSSLSYLKHLPITRLKIDRSFVIDINQSARDQAIVSAIVSMARQLWIDVVAEGVETEEQLSAVSNCECHTVQGYFYSKPLTRSEFEQKYIF